MCMNDDLISVITCNLSTVSNGTNYAVKASMNSRARETHVWDRGPASRTRDWKAVTQELVTERH